MSNPAAAMARRAAAAKSGVPAKMTFIYIGFLKGWTRCRLLFAFPANKKQPALFLRKGLQGFALAFFQFRFNPRLLERRQVFHKQFADQMVQFVLDADGE